MIDFTCGDVTVELPKYPENTFDGCLCDPPYGLSFMGKSWDHGVPSVEVWREVLRVLKPGTMLMAFGGTRTWHRLACAIEDAGFELRDTIMWLYGTGHPRAKSLLKPAWEPVLVCQKVTRDHPTAGLNTDAGRNESGRWPSNVVFDNESAGLLDTQSGVSRSTKLNCVQQARIRQHAKGDERVRVRSGEGYEDSGGASRFFYVAKSSRKERGEGNNHPTVKPLALCTYLARLILPPPRDLPRCVLVPFAGSGSEALGCEAAGWDLAVGIEKEAAYVEIAKRRAAP